MGAPVRPRGGDPAIQAHRRLLTQAERQALERLRGDLQEIDQWVREHVPGAAQIAEQIKRRLLRLAGVEEPE